MPTTTKKPKGRGFHLPERLPDATDFGSSREDLHPLWVVQAVKAQPQLMAPLRAAGEAAASHHGAKRKRGDWPLVYLAFVFSGQVDVEPWWRTAGHSIWRTAGFRGRPSYPTTNRRFVELEEHADAFAQVAQILIERARKATDGRVGRHVMIDSTEAQTNARLKHCCPPSWPCARPHRARYASTSTPNTTVADDRHAQACGDSPENPHEVSIGDASQLIEDRHGKRILVGGCWYRLRDQTAGTRAYKNGNRAYRVWTGFFNGKAVDSYTGAVLAVHMSPADVNESSSYPQLYERIAEAIGGHPEAIVADRGYNVASVFEHNTRRGVATVTPWRRSKGRPNREMEDTDRYDRHGIPRCRHCGAPTRFVRFQRNTNSGPRLHFQCATPAQTGCKRIQTIACKENWRLLLPLWRTSEIYQALRTQGRPMERLHTHWRSRYRVAPDNFALRPKRIGSACQQLRANAAVAIEWLIICAREGWFQSLRRLRRAARRATAYTIQGAKAAASLFAARRTEGLEKPYGKHAHALALKPSKSKPSTRRSVAAARRRRRTPPPLASP